jgi:uncharacterized protein YbaP (TraB family)
VLVCWACATPQPAPRDTGLLFLWEVESGSPEGARAHLLGSIHLARKDLRFDPAVEAAFASSRALVVELDLRALDAAASSALVLEHGRLPQGPSLDELVSEAAWSEFTALLDAHGQSTEFYRGFEPWVAMLAASALLASEKDLSGEAGVDRAFLERAGAREVIALETLELQLALFDELPLDQQVLLLEAVVAEADDSRDSLGELYEAWRLGDAEFLASIALDDGGDPALAALQERMYADRNQAMVERIDALLHEGGEQGRYFVVVGAGHMVGDSGIPALLRDRGHRVRRVVRSP